MKSSRSHELRPKDFTIVRRHALHLSRSAPSAHCDPSASSGQALPLDKGRIFKVAQRVVSGKQNSPRSEGKKEIGRETNLEEVGGNPPV
jgi:hypothetical protein